MRDNQGVSNMKSYLSLNEVAMGWEPGQGITVCEAMCSSPDPSLPNSGKDDLTF